MLIVGFVGGDAMRGFLVDRIRLVREIIASDIEVSYADLGLILCTVMTACASRRWPGKRIDQHRFVELLVQESPPDFHASWVCVPELINKGLVAESDTPYGPDGNTIIFCDEDVDLTLADAKAKYPQVSTRELKRCSYAMTIYDRLRCGYAHEYCPHENITHFPPSRREARISYIGRTLNSGELLRMVSFHLDYLIRLAEHHAQNLADVPAHQPNVWWLDDA
jgi:hypothetical protein